jgi:hypothetical protein
VLALLAGDQPLGRRDGTVQSLGVLDGERLAPPRPGGGVGVRRPSGTLRLVERRHRLVDPEIRGVSYHSRIVTYQNAAKTVLKVTRSSIL